MASESLFRTGGVYKRFLARTFPWKWNRGSTAGEQGEEVDRAMKRLAGTVQVHLVECCPLALAHIAVWHTRLYSYRGYTLYTDQSGKTYLIDQSCQYLTDSVARLVCVEGYDRTKVLVDTLLAPLA